MERGKARYLHKGTFIFRRTGWIYLTCRNFQRISLLIFVSCLQSWTYPTEVFLEDIVCYV